MIIRLSIAEDFETFYFFTTLLEGADWRGLVSAVPAEGLRNLAENMRRDDHAGLADGGFEGEFAEAIGRELLVDVGALLAGEQESAPLLIVRPPRSLADVPWGLAMMPSGQRALQAARVRIGLPLGIQAQRRTQSQAQAELTAVVDPYSSVPPILDRAGRRHWSQLLAQAHAAGVPGAIVRRTDLRGMLAADPRALFFYGHCVASDEGRLSQMGLLLSDTAEIAGAMHPRILSARDLVVGTLRSPEPGLPDGVQGADLWPMPPRVAIVGCSSGLDARGVEPLGLAGVLHNNGADWILGTLWDVPSDAASSGGASQLAEAALRCLVADDPDQAFDEWQRSALQNWLDDPAAAPDPRTWAAATVFTSADAVVEPAM